MDGWFRRNTWQSVPWSAGELVTAKRGRTVSVVLPALNEQRTVGAIVAAIHPFTEPQHGVSPLVDELVVMDSGSTDHTASVAARAGARVVRREDVLPEIEVRPGKGEVLWRSLPATSGDVLVFVDADLVDFDPGFVPALLGPLLTEEKPVLVKGFYRRPKTGTDGGGRVTEILARPLVAALRPELQGVVQPLGGEYAARREFLEKVPFAAGYGVDLGLLLDAHSHYGLAGIAQVNLGMRKHRNRDLAQLSVMSRQVLAAALRRSGVDEAAIRPYWQFAESAGQWQPHLHDVLLADRPPSTDVGIR